MRSGSLWIATAPQLGSQGVEEASLRYRRVAVGLESNAELSFQQRQVFFYTAKNRQATKE